MHYTYKETPNVRAASVTLITSAWLSECGLAELLAIQLTQTHVPGADPALA